MIVNRNWIRVFVCCMLVLMAAASVRPAFGQAGSAQVGVFQAYEGKPGTRLEIPVEIKMWKIVTRSTLNCTTTRKS
jgi:hypothetical protein